MAGQGMTQEQAVTCFSDFLRAIWKDNDEETALLLFRERARMAPHLAERDLACVEAIADDPPPNLIDIMQQDGWLILEDEPDPETVVTRSLDEHVQWLREMAARFRAEALS
jgi:hypothetical protein